MTRWLALTPGEEVSKERLQSEGFAEYLKVLRGMKCKCVEAERIREILVSSLSQLHLPQAQYIVRLNKECSVVEEECGDVYMARTPLSFAAVGLMDTTKAYNQLKEVEINQLANAVRQLLQVVDDINARKERIVLKSIEKEQPERPELTITEKESAIGSLVKQWLAEKNKLGYIRNRSDISISRQYCRDWALGQVKDVSPEEFDAAYDTATAGWFDAKQK